MHEEVFFDLLRSRRSVRAFTDRLPDRALLDRLIEAARWAPSNHNRQGWKFLVFQDKAQIRELARTVYRLPMADKPSNPCLASRIAFGTPVVEALTVMLST